jgi:hypothetical protein
MTLQDTLYQELLGMKDVQLGCYYHHSLPIRAEDVRFYQHPDGWIVREAPGIEHKLWIYIHCRICGYDTAIWKIGVPRDYVFGLPENWKPVRMQHYDRRTIREEPRAAECSPPMDAEQNNISLMEKAMQEGTVSTRFRIRSEK